MDFKGILLIGAVLFASIYTGGYGTYQYIGYKYPEITREIKLNIGVADNGDDITHLNAVTNNAPIITDTEENHDTALPTATESEAKGKIISRFISPYGAGISYNHVYLKNNTDANIDLMYLLNKKLPYVIQKNTKPQVLIMHTHTTESYMGESRDFYTEADASRSLENDKNMVAIGTVIAEKLTQSGIGVIHDTTVHDHPSYSGSYNRSAETVKKNLEKYPTIKIVIDVHRDAISDSEVNKVKPIVEIDGKKTAQVMLVMGSETGGVSGYPNWQDNLSLAVKYQQMMEVTYPGFARAITLNSAKYNQGLTAGSILLEVGSDANTLEEAKNAAERAGESLVALLNTVK